MSLFDIAMAIVFALVGWRSCAALLRERPVLREFGVSLILVPILLLYPVAHLVALAAGWVSSASLVREASWALCAALYGSAWYIARRQSEALCRSGTSRTQVAQDAVSNAHGFAMLGLALVATRVVVSFILASIRGV